MSFAYSIVNISPSLPCPICQQICKETNGLAVRALFFVQRNSKLPSEPLAKIHHWFRRAALPLSDGSGMNLDLGGQLSAGQPGCNPGGLELKWKRCRRWPERVIA